MIRFRTTAALLMAGACFVGCSGQAEAVTREAQEREFRELLGFPPSEAIVEIRVADASHRGVVDAAYVRWLRCTYTAETWDRARQERGAAATTGEAINRARREAIDEEIAPGWFREGHAEPVVALSLLGHEDTPQDEGYAFEEILWHDGRWIYLCKRYWD